MNKEIKYQCRRSIESILNKTTINTNSIKVLIISDNSNMYKEILQKLNIEEKNISIMGVSNFDFFTDTTLVNNSFDLIIGNPPNTRQEKLKELKPIVKEYKSFNNTADLNIYFFEKGYNLLKENGVLSYITSNKYKRARYGKEFRVFLLDNTSILEYIDFTDTGIMTFGKSQKENNTFYYCKVEKDKLDLEDYITKHRYEYLENNLEINIFNFLSSKVLSIKKSIESYDTIDSEIYSSQFMMAILNSKLVVFYKSLFYKNDIKKLTIPKIDQKRQKPFEVLVEYILFAKEQDMSHVASLFESIIDGIVYDLYFEEDMKKADCFITSRVEEIVKPWSKYDNYEFKKELVSVIYDIFKEDKTIQRGLIFSRNIEVVKIINGDKKDD